MEHSSISLQSKNYNIKIVNDFVPIILALLNVLIANLLINHIQYFQNNTPNKILLFITIFLISYSVSQFFLSIYSESIQTSFILEHFYKNM
jgi:hypothetical protein